MIVLNKIGICLVNQNNDYIPIIKDKFRNLLPNYKLDFFYTEKQADYFTKIFNTAFDKRLYEINHRFTYYINILYDCSDSLIDYFELPNNLHFRTLYYYKGNWRPGLGTGIFPSMFCANSLTFNHACEYYRCYFRQEPHELNFYKFLKSRQISTICLTKNNKELFVEF